MVIHHIGPFSSKEIDKARIVDVHLHQPGPGIDVFPFACAQIVHDDDLVAGRDIGIHDMGADKASSAGDEDFHKLAFSVW